MAINRITILLAIILVIPACKTSRDNQNTHQAPVTVTTFTAKLIEANREIKLSGNVEGFRTVRLGFMVAGKIDYIACNEGETVSKGKMLASIDASSYEIAKELADIQVNQVQDEFNRLNEMHDLKSISESDFAKISFGLQQAKAQQKLHAKNLADTKLYSPIDGILLKKLCEAGEITGVGLPLFVVSDIRKVKVNAAVPESEIHFIRIGTDASVDIPALGKNYKGLVREVGAAADPMTRTFTVRIDVENPSFEIRPGMIAEVTCKGEKVEKLLAVPVEALLHDINGLTYVYVADTLKHIAFRRNINTGRILDSNIEIVSGISEREKVINGGQQKLIDGSLIEIR